jgi:hypothetical protein
LGLSFFGLTSNDNTAQVKLAIYKQIHQICFFGKGGYSWPVVYNMPVYLRRFVFNEMKQFYEEEKAANENAAKKHNSPSKKQPTQTQTFNMGAPTKGKPPVSYQ